MILRTVKMSISDTQILYGNKDDMQWQHIHLHTERCKVTLTSPAAFEPTFGESSKIIPVDITAGRTAMAELIKPYRGNPSTNQAALANTVRVIQQFPSQRQLR